MQNNTLCNLKVHGHLTIVDGNGNLILSKNNLVLRGAKTIMASALAGGPSCDRVAYISFGDDDTAPLVTDVSLGNQTNQIVCGYDCDTPPYFEDQEETDGTETLMGNVVFSGIVDSDTELAIKEAGLFSIKEFMFSRVTFSEITKSAGTSWLVTWKLELSLT